MTAHCHVGAALTEIVGRYREVRLPLVDSPAALKNEAVSEKISSAAGGQRCRAIVGLGANSGSGSHQTHTTWVKLYLAETQLRTDAWPRTGAVTGAPRRVGCDAL
jgi:hypothetical protein